MHSVADVPAKDGCDEEYGPRDAIAEGIDSSVEHVSSASRAAESAKKQSTFPVRGIHPKGSGEELEVKRGFAQAKKPKTTSNVVKDSGKRIEKRKSKCSVKN